MRLCTVIIILACCWPLLGTAAANNSTTNADSPRAADRQQLRQLLADVTEALNAHDFETLKQFMRADIIVTFQNAEAVQGVAAVHAYFQRMLAGDNALLDGFSSRGDIDGPAVFYDNTAVAYGHSIDTFEFANGSDFQLNARWSATLVKENDDWQVALLHFSSNLFDNPVLTLAQTVGWIIAALAFVLGLLCAWLSAVWRRRRA